MSRAADVARRAGVVVLAASALLQARDLRGQDVLSFAKTFVRAEPVAGSLVSIGGDVHLSGVVARDLIVLGGDAVLEPGARVTGDLLVVGGNVRGANARASVSGEMRTVPALEAAFLSEIETSPVAGHGTFGLLVSLRLALLCLWLAAGSLLLFLAPRRLAAATETLPSSAPLDALLGAIGLLSGTLLSAFLLSVLPARPALAAMTLVLLFLLAAKAFGLAVLFLRIGRRITARARRGATLWGDPSALAVGLVLLGVLSLVPLAGRILWMAASLVALGVALGTGFGRPAETGNLTLSARRAESRGAGRTARSLLEKGDSGMTIQRLGVIGAGQMGSGIAHVSALAGKTVVLLDVEQSFVDRGVKSIEKNMGRQVEKGKVTAETRDAALAAISGATDLRELAGCDLVVEAIVEDEAVKRDLFTKLDALVKPGAILASNTSSISITRLAAVTKRPESVIGMHFMNPVPVMTLVEVIRGIATSDETAAAVTSFAKELGKTPVECRDFPGFVSNRVLMPMINEAITAVHEGVATADAVDQIMKLGMNHPMGPLTLADFIGLDTCLSILRVLHRGLGDDKYRPCPLLVQMVDAGWHGKKAGRGFYRYSGPGGERIAA